MPESTDKTGSGADKWYDLFSRGARDWLRHDEKVRESVRKHLPQIISGADVINEGARTVRVPARMLEHYHFRLRRPEEQQGAGQGKAKARPVGPTYFPIPPSSAAPERKARAARMRVKSISCSNSKSTTSSIGCGK